MRDKGRKSLESPFGLSLDAWGRMVLIDTDGRRFVGVEPVRAFPMTSATEWVSVVDSEGHEVVLIEDLARLPDGMRSLLEQELARREFVPVIQQILNISSDTTPSDWDVVTDRGPTRFTLDSDEGIRRLGPRRVLITDARGTRYEVRDVRSLDSACRRRLERYL
jgi:hypothetical protein